MSSVEKYTSQAEGKNTDVLLQYFDPSTEVREAPSRAMNAARTKASELSADRALTVIAVPAPPQPLSSPPPSPIAALPSLPTFDPSSWGSLEHILDANHAADKVMLQHLLFKCLFL